MTRDNLVRRLLSALADSTPAFTSAPGTEEHGYIRRLLSALADSTPAFRSGRTPDEYTSRPHNMLARTFLRRPTHARADLPTQSPQLPGMLRGGWRRDMILRSQGHHLAADAIVAFVDGELSLSAHERAARHLANCRMCTAEVAAQRQASTAARNAGAPAVPQTLLAALHDIQQSAADADNRDAPRELAELREMYGLLNEGLLDELRRLADAGYRDAERELLAKLLRKAAERRLREQGSNLDELRRQADAGDRDAARELLAKLLRESWADK